MLIMSPVAATAELELDFGFVQLPHFLQNAEEQLPHVLLHERHLNSQQLMAVPPFNARRVRRCVRLCASISTDRSPEGS